MKTVQITQQEYEQFQSMKTEIEALKQQVEELQKMNRFLSEQYRIRQKKMFGRSSEKIVEGQLSLFDEAEFTCEPSREEPDVEEVKSYARRKRTSTKESLPEDLPVKEVNYELTESERSCPECGTVMEEVGRDVRERLVLIPASAYILREIRHIYACGSCSKNGESTPFAEAVFPKAVIPKSFATAEAISQILTQKFVMGAPLYRQEQELERRGIPLSRQTMSNWILKAAAAYFEPVYEVMKRRLAQEQILHADETTVQVLHEDGKPAASKSYMWLYRTGNTSPGQTIVYEYQPNRKAENPLAFLKEFKGYLHTDGYAVYHMLPPSVTVVGCHAHARRNFNDAYTALPAKARAGSIAEKALKYYSALFRLEQDFSSLSAEERHAERLKRSKPVLDEFYEWLRKIKPKVSEKSATGKAVNYMFAQKKYLDNYLLDGRLEMTNNLAERSIKPFVMARKNFLFSNTPGGAKASAMAFSLIETARANHLDAYEYLKWVLRKAPDMDLQNHPENAEMLLPEHFNPAEFPSSKPSVV